MPHGAPNESRWLRAEPRRSVPAKMLQKIAETAFPGYRAFDVQPLTDGYRNANFKVQLDPTHESVVLRMYEHDPSLCGKEVDLLNLKALGSRS